MAKKLTQEEFTEKANKVHNFEYDGLQHYKAIDWFGGEEAFKSQKLRDKIKNEYCLNNGIKLIRIPYWKINNINIILEAIEDIKDNQI